MTQSPLNLASHRLVICLGPGGVGKTTISAALAVRSVLEGRSVDVMTVDPAPRLLDALGLDASSPELQDVPLDGIGGRARGNRKVNLRALKLDPKVTFDALVARYAPSEAARDAMLQNRIYRNLSNALSGVADYMATEKLLELYTAPNSDLIVLDTPPASDALDFLDAPRRLLDLLNSRALTLLGGASRGLMGGLKMIDIAARAVLSAFDRLARLNLLADVQAFVDAFDGMYAGFAERAERAHKLLSAPETAIVVVTTANSGRITQATEFVAALEKAGMPVDAVIVNRTMASLPDPSEISSLDIPASLKRKLRRNLADFQMLHERETRAFGELRAASGEEISILAAQDLGHEPRSLSDLAEIAKHLELIRPAAARS
ncbi:MAG TPA: ArsA-related P-loop ATPase [Candidatus Binataceae bacterium]|nr:ArsA-related P-loop ATPase [Candidatus Binataceae bacterium]